GQVEADEVILIGAVVGEENRRRVELRDDQVGGAVAVDVRGDEAARGVELKGVEAESRADVVEGAVAAIAQHTELRARGSVDEDNEIDPAVVIDVDGGDAPAARSIREGKIDALEAAAGVVGCGDVAPEGDAGSAVVRDGDVHPAVFVEVEDGDAGGGR